MRDPPFESDPLTIIVYQICELRHLRSVPIILFLNKEDLFDAKILVSPLNRAFPNYEGTRLLFFLLVRAGLTQFQKIGGTDAKKGKEYILARYLELMSIRQSKEYYSHFTCAIDTNNIKRIFESVRGILLSKTIVDIGL